MKFCVTINNNFILIITSYLHGARQRKWISLLRISLLLPCARMRSRVMRPFVYMCIYMSTKNRLFSALLLKNLLLSVMCCLLFEFKRLQYGLLRPASCTDGVIPACFSKYDVEVPGVAAVGSAVVPVVCSHQRVFVYASMQQMEFQAQPT